MNSEEYIESIKQMMEIQDRVFNWFLAIIGILLAIAVVMQWRFSNKQLESVITKNKATILEETAEIKKEYEDKINFERIKNLKEVEILKHELDKINSTIESELLSIKMMNINKFRIELFSTSNLPMDKFTEFQYILDVYNSVFKEEPGLFNLYINYLDSWIFSNNDYLKKEEAIFYIDRIIKTLEMIEENLEDESHSNLKGFKEKMKVRLEIVTPKK